MDRGRRLAGSLTAAVLLLAAADAPLPPIAEARWLDRAALPDALLTRPAECLAIPVGTAERRSVAIGRAAFRTPLLLGGQAARAGLNCASCHRNGRGNPHFSFPGLSGAPGTADITSSLMSSHRGDGHFNPKPIPDLALSAPKVSRDRSSGALDRFIRGLIVEEFDGPEPPPAVLLGLADYVRAVSARGCPSNLNQPVGLGDALADVDAAIAAAGDAAAAGDRASQIVLVGAARSNLGQVDERFQVVGLESSRALLRRADADLRAIRGMSPRPAAAALRAWQRRWPPRLRMLAKQEQRSLFAPDVLRTSFGGTSSRGVSMPPA